MMLHHHYSLFIIILLLASLSSSLVSSQQSPDLSFPSADFSSPAQTSFDSIYGASSLTFTQLPARESNDEQMHISINNCTIRYIEWPTNARFTNITVTVTNSNLASMLIPSPIMDGNVSFIFRNTSFIEDIEDSRSARQRFLLYFQEIRSFTFDFNIEVRNCTFLREYYYFTKSPPINPPSAMMYFGLLMIEIGADGAEDHQKVGATVSVQEMIDRYRTLPVAAGGPDYYPPSPFQHSSNNESTTASNNRFFFNNIIITGSYFHDKSNVTFRAVFFRLNDPVQIKSANSILEFSWNTILQAPVITPDAWPTRLGEGYAMQFRAYDRAADSTGSHLGHIIVEHNHASFSSQNTRGFQEFFELRISPVTIAGNVSMSWNRCFTPFNPNNPPPSSANPESRSTLYGTTDLCVRLACFRMKSLYAPDESLETIKRVSFGNVDSANLGGASITDEDRKALRQSQLVKMNFNSGSMVARGRIILVDSSGTLTHGFYKIEMNNNTLETKSGPAPRVIDFRIQNVTHIHRIEAYYNRLDVKISRTHSIGNDRGSNAVAVFIADRRNAYSLDSKGNTVSVPIASTGFYMVDEVDAQYNIVNAEIGGGAACVDFSFYANDMKSIVMANNVMNSIAKSDTPVVPSRNLTLSSWSGVARLGDGFKNVGAIIVENNTANVTFEFSTDLAVLRLWTKSDSKNITSIIYRSNVVFMEKTANGFINNHYASAISIGVNNETIQEINYLEVSNNTILFVLRNPEARCPMFSCNGISLAVNGDVSDVRMLNISNNNVQILNQVSSSSVRKSMGSSGIIICAAKLKLPDGGSTSIITRIDLLPATLTDIGKLVIANNNVTVIDDTSSTPIAFPVSGVVSGRSVSILNNNLHSSANNVVRRVSSGALDISCPLFSLELLPGYIINSVCQQSRFSFDRVEIINNTVVGGSSFFSSTSSTNISSLLLIQNSTWSSGKDFSKTLSELVPYSSSNTNNFAVAGVGIQIDAENFVLSSSPGQVSKITISHFNADVTTFCTSTSDQLIDPFKRILPSKKAGLLWLGGEVGGVSSAHISDTNYTVTCAEASAATNNRRRVTGIFVGNKITRFDLQMNRSTVNFKSADLFPSEALRVDFLSADLFSTTSALEKAPLRIQANFSSIDISTSGSSLDSFATPSDGKPAVDASTPQRLQLGINVSLQCAKWNKDPIFSRKSPQFASTSSLISKNEQLQVIPCEGYVPSFSQTLSDPSVTNTKVQTETHSDSESPSSSLDVIPDDLGLPEAILANLESAATIGTSIAVVVANNPSSLITAVRSAATMRLAMCRMSGVKAFNIPERDAFLDNFTARELKRQLDFPKLLIPTFNLGNEIGSSYRAALLMNIILVVVLVCIGLYQATLSKTSWKKLVINSDRKEGEKFVRQGDDDDDDLQPSQQEEDEEDREMLMNTNEDDDGTQSSIATRNTSSLSSSPHLRRHNNNKLFSFSPSSANTTASGINCTSNELVLAAARQHSGYIQQNRKQQTEYELKQRRKEAERLKREEEAKKGVAMKSQSVGVFSSSSPSQQRKKKKSALQKQREQEEEIEKQKQQELELLKAADSSTLTFSAAAEAVAEMSIFKFWSIDRILLKVIVLILPAWCRTAAAMASTAPSGFVDYLLSVLPIGIVGVSFFICAYYIWTAVSSVEGTPTADDEEEKCTANGKKGNKKNKGSNHNNKSFLFGDQNTFEDPLLKEEKLLLAKTSASSLARRKKAIRDKRQKEEEEMMTPMMRRKLEKKKLRELQKIEKEEELNQIAQREQMARIRELRIQKQLEREEEERFDGEEEEEDEESSTRRKQKNVKKKRPQYYSRHGGRSAYDDYEDNNNDDEIETTTGKKMKQLQWRARGDYDINNDDDDNDENENGTNNSNNIVNRRQRNGISISPSPTRSSKKLPDPLFFVEQSELYFPIGASSKLQHFMHRALQHPVSRFLLVGNHTWYSPYLVLGTEQIVIPGPGLHTNFPYVFSTYWGPTKRPLKASVVSVLKKKKEQQQQQKMLSEAAVAARRRGRNNTNNSRNNYRYDDLDINNDDEYEEELQSIVSSIHPNSPSPATINSNNNDDDENRLIFETSFAHRVSSIWIFISLVAAVIAMSFVGAADVSPQSCYGAFFVNLFAVTLPIFLGSVFLRPYLVPMRNVALVTLEFSAALGGIMFLFVLLATDEDSDNGQYKRVISAAQIFSTVPAAVLGPLMTSFGLVRLVMLIIGKSKLVTLTKLRSHLPKELDLAGQRVLGKMDDREMRKMTQKRRFFGIDASWFFDE